MVFFSKVKDWIKFLPEDTKLLVYTFLLLLVIWIIFDPIKFNWADDPFQKVVLAPLGEEPFKLLLAFMFCLAIIIGLRLPQILNKVGKKPLRKIYFLDVFSYSFVPFAIISAVIFGVIYK